MINFQDITKANIKNITKIAQEFLIITTEY